MWKDARKGTNRGGGGGGAVVGAPTSMPVGVHCIGSCYGKVVQQAEAMAASGVIGTGHHPCGTRVMPWGPDRAESIPYLRACMDATGAYMRVRLRSKPAFRCMFGPWTSCQAGLVRCLNQCCKGDHDILCVSFYVHSCFVFREEGQCEWWVRYCARRLERHSKSI